MMDWDTVSKELAKKLDPANERQRMSAFRRFMSKVNIPDDQKGCWEWTGSRPSGRYGHFSPSEGKAVKAHRWIYEAVMGIKIPDGLVVRHICDNPPCVNPEHLTIGTVTDNNRDRDRRGRGADRKGEKHPLSKLTAEDVLEIRKLNLLGRTHKELAEEFKIGRGQIGKIVRRENWSHI